MSEDGTRIESSLHTDTVNIIPPEEGKGGTSRGRPPVEGMVATGLSRGELSVAFVLVGCLSLLAIILAAVAIGRSSKGQLPETDKSVDLGDDYVWTFASGHLAHALEYIDESTGQLRGFSIDLIDAVCKEANKNCKVIWDLYKNCWDSEPGVPAHGGVGLLGRWYDACSAWVQTRDRLNTFKFSKPFVRDQRSPVAIYTAPTTVFDWRDMTGRTVGFLDGWVIDESCFMLYDEIQGFNKSNVRHFATMDDFTAAIKQNEIDCGFMFLQESLRSQLKVLTPADGLESKCWVESSSVMTRKDSRLTLWWNDAFDKIRTNGKYKEVCKDLIEVHGYKPEPGAPPSFCLDD